GAGVGPGVGVGLGVALVVDGRAEQGHDRGDVVDVDVLCTYCRVVPGIAAVVDDGDADLGDVRWAGPEVVDELAVEAAVASMRIEGDLAYGRPRRTTARGVSRESRRVRVG